MGISFGIAANQLNFAFGLPKYHPSPSRPSSLPLPVLPHGIHVLPHYSSVLLVPLRPFLLPRAVTNSRCRA